MTPLALRNRPHVERRVLMLLRGAPLARSPRSSRFRDAPEPSPAQLRRFTDLRRAATRYGLVVHSPETPYVCEGELRLLSWLAEAQRIAGARSAPNDPRLVATIAACAGLLDGLGLRLSPLTLYGARLRGTAPPRQGAQLGP